MQLEEKTPVKRPLSFSDDSYEWDSIRDDLPVDMGWNSMNCEVKCEDEDLRLTPNDFSIEWVPSGQKLGSRRTAKRRKLDIGVAASVQKPRSEFTHEFLDENDKKVAKHIMEAISTSAGTFEFESASNEVYARLLPFPAGVSDDRTARGDWKLDPTDCKLESLLSESSQKICRDVSFPPWTSAQRGERKYETLHVDRTVKIEDLSVEEGEFSWPTLESVIKDRFTAMEPSARLSMAKRIAEMLDEKPESSNTSV